MYIAVDFDGTCVTHEYPKVGKDIGAAPVLKKLIKEGHQLILHTMRDGKELDDAVQWFNKNGIPLYGINENPSRSRWTTSPKIFAHLYIDDAALGMPMVTYDSSLAPHRPYVNWKSVEVILKKKGVINE